MTSLSATTKTFWRLGIPSLSLGVAMVLLAACFGDGDEGPGIVITPVPEATPTETVTESPEEAIARYVAEKGEEYAGDCAEASQDQDIGKTCTAFQNERENQRAYLAGITFSEFTIWLFVEKSDGRWSVVATQPLHEVAADVPGVPWPLAVGDEALVVGTGDCLNVREGPGLEAPAVDCIPDGTEVVLAQGPMEEDGYLWWRLESRAGWVAADWLRLPEEGP
jgi:hypothetical protein